MNSDEYFPLLGSRLLYLFELKNIR